MGKVSKKIIQKMLPFYLAVGTKNSTFALAKGKKEGYNLKQNKQ